MSEPRWIAKQAIQLLHAASIAEHGGAEGMRDEGALESALARPLNRFSYGETSDLCLLAAAYAAGISQNYPFVDGNKRASFIAMGLFLALNGLRLQAGQVDATRTMLALAAGNLTEAELADWIRANARTR